jgi:hypothetical protein
MGWSQIRIDCGIEGIHQVRVMTSNGYWTTELTTANVAVAGNGSAEPC